MKSGSLKVDDAVEAAVDADRRKAIMRAHSATHLLQKALQEVLGDHVRQAGSYVDEDKLRFDFTHFSAVETDELMLVMSKVNDMILDGMDVDIKEMPIDEARKMGAMALFGEKYGDTVRVVNMGGKSIEFCGGTHVDNTAKVGPFRIVSESSVASGVRRIEAITGKEYLSEAETNNRRTMKVASMLKTTPTELLHRTEGFMNEMRDLRQNMDKLKDKLMSGDAERVLYAAKTIGGFKVLTITRSDLTPADLRKLGDFLRDREPNTVAVLATATEGKVQFVAVCGKNAVARGIKAGELVGAVSAVAGGKGGGKPDSAMGGGTDVLKTDDALAIVDDFVANKLGL
jgi:alanyl-tRNA synthetase